MRKQREKCINELLFLYNKYELFRNQFYTYILHINPTEVLSSVPVHKYECKFEWSYS